jgi:2-dehydropantoate 2-reductase
MGKDLQILNGEEEKIVNSHQFTYKTKQALSGSQFDCILIAVKAFDTDGVIEQIREMQLDFETIVCLQNGVENEGKFQTAFPEKNIIGASIVSAVSRLEDACVKVEKNRGIGLAGKGPIYERLFNDLERAGLRPQRYLNLASMKWSKMISNLFGNAMSAILDMTPYEIYSRKSLFRAEMKQIRETVCVMHAMGLRVENLPGLPLKTLVWLIRYMPDFLLKPLLTASIAKGRGDKMPSFYIEKSKGSKKSEVNYLNGAVVRFGEAYDVATPVNRLLTDTLNEILSNEQTDKAYSHHPEVLEETLTN